eukprot:13144470-Alexandrium_andersonii.AAC.1
MKALNRISPVNTEQNAAHGNTTLHTPSQYRSRSSLGASEESKSIACSAHDAVNNTPRATHDVQHAT